MQTFKNRNLQHETAQSTYVWKLKDKAKPFTIKWEEHAKSRSFVPGNKVCKLCVDEKYAIMNADKYKSLNKLSEFIAKCRHKRKYLLAAIKNDNIVDDSRKKHKEPEIKIKKACIKLKNVLFDGKGSINMTPKVRLIRMGVSNNQMKEECHGNGISKRITYKNRKYYGDDWKT